MSRLDSKRTIGYSGLLASWLAISTSLGCSGHVDLGTSVAGGTPQPTTNSAETAAQTTSLVTYHTYYVTGLASDPSYLYLAISSFATPFEYYLQRCKKSDCLNTLTVLRGPIRDFGGLRQAAGKLGWVGEDGFALCDAPECSKPSVVDGIVFQGSGVNLTPTWDNEVITWPISNDRAIYRCDMPRCAAGPKLVASKASVIGLTLVDQDIYWLDNHELLRTAKNGSRAVEQLTLEAPLTTWVPRIAEMVKMPDCAASELAVDGSWVYATLLPIRNGACGSPCAECDAGLDLVRWRHDDSGAEREWILVDDVDYDEHSVMRIFDGEIVWGGNDGKLWSCLADDCAATKRQFGVDGFLTNFAAGAATDTVVADDQFIYWLSTSASDPNAGQIHVKEWNLKRTPRLAR